MLARAPVASSARVAHSLRSAATPSSRAAGRRFATTGRPRPPQDAQAGAGAGAGGRAWSSGWMSAAAIFAACGLGWATSSMLNSRPVITNALQPSDISIQHHNKFQPTYGSREDYRKAIDEIEKLWKSRGKADRVSTDSSDLESHGISDWSYHKAHLPTVVVWVDTTEEVQDLVRISNKYRVPITPFSGGTSLEGHFSSPFGGISLDVSLMDKIISVSEADAEAVCGPGVKWEDLNEHLAKKGIPLFFPIDPGPGATLGGMAGTGCSGTNAVRYGTAKGEWFLNLTVVLPTGEVIKTRSSARKSSAGWDATKMFLGAEGTLGIVTQVTVRLAPLLPTKVAVVNFPGVEEAVRAATEVTNTGYPVQCIEYLDSHTMKAINQGGLTGRTYPEKDTVFFKFQGSEAMMKEVAKGVKDLAAKYGGKDFEFSKSEKEAEDLWAGRKAALWSVLALRDNARVWTTDVCVPISKLPHLVQETRDDFDKRGLQACHFGHVGDGNVHTLVLFDNEEELARVRVAVHEMVERAIRLNGTCSGEHGVGIGKIEYLTEELGQGTVNFMETCKRTIDPYDLMNPGKIYPNIKPKGADIVLQKKVEDYPKKPHAH